MLDLHLCIYSHKILITLMYIKTTHDRFPLKSNIVTPKPKPAIEPKLEIGVYRILA